jgi:GT2 family glycosyltransferase
MFSIIMPIDTNRLEQFTITKREYDKMPQVKEFIMPTRSFKEVAQYLDDNALWKDVKLVKYTHKLGFNPSKALNLGVRNAKYDQIIITSPEVKPLTDVLGQLEGFIGRNVVCQVFDAKGDGTEGISLVNKNFRGDNPGMYFLAMFNRSDIEKINGWDEEFMKGYAYEDNDFGERWKRAGLPFEVVDEIRGFHQYHPRSETIPGGMVKNQQHFYNNTDNNITYCKNGLL